MRKLPNGNMEVRLGSDDAVWLAKLIERPDGQDSWVYLQRLEKNDKR